MGKLIVGQKHQSSEIYKLYKNAITNDIGKSLTY